MDQRHLLKAQRSQTASHRGLPRPPYQIPGRPPLSPLIASQLSHLNPTPINTDRFPTPVFTGRIQQPHLACAGPASPHVLERQREFKDASMMQAKLAQQRAILAHQVSSAPIHGMEDRVQYVPALMPNRSPEDSLAQLRRLHQQVLSMPNQEPHVYEVPSSNRQRDVRRETPTEAELLAFGSKERLQMMEKHLLASKQLTASEQHERIVLYRDRLQQTSASQGEPSYPVVGNRLTTNRPSLFSHTDLAAAQSLNYRLFQNSAAVNARMIQEIEKLREQEHLTRHDQLIYQQKQIPSPSPRLSPQGVPSSGHPNFRSRLHASYVANMERPKEKPSPPVRWEQNIGMPSHLKHYTEQSLPQIKHVKSLAQVKNVPDEKMTKRIDNPNCLMKMMENRIKQELDKDGDACPSSHDMNDHSKRSEQSSAMTKVPSRHHPPPPPRPPPQPPTTSSNLPAIVQRHFKAEPMDISEEQSSLPQDLSSPSGTQSNSGVENKPLRKRHATRDSSEVPPAAKRSRGIGDIFKSRLAEYASLPSSSRPGTSDGTVSSSILPGETPKSHSVEQPLDLSVNASQKVVDTEQKERCKDFSVPLSNSLNNPFPNILQFGKFTSKLEGPTISDIISHAVVASLEKPYPIAEGSNHVVQTENSTVEHTDQTSSTSGRDETDHGGSSVSEEECQQQLIDLLSTQFAGSFRNFLVSLLSECKNESVVKTLAISKAGEKVPVVMKEELERCNLKISQTIRTLLESGEEKDKTSGIRTEGTSAEARTENDTSPPCQVSTTTDIWQHSPPVSPESELASRSRELATKAGATDIKVEETGRDRPATVEKISGHSDSEDVEDIQERKMPSIMKVESLATLSENKPANSCDQLLLEDHLEDDAPLSIDDEAGVGQKDETEGRSDIHIKQGNQTHKANAADKGIEEDAIDFLKFGNEEIDAEERDKRSAKKDSTDPRDNVESHEGSVCEDSTIENTCPEEKRVSEISLTNSTTVKDVVAVEDVATGGSEREGSSEAVAGELIDGEGNGQIPKTDCNDASKVNEGNPPKFELNEEDEEEEEEEEEEENKLVIAENPVTEDNLHGVCKNEEVTIEASTKSTLVEDNSNIVQKKPDSPLTVQTNSLSLTNAAPSQPPVTVISTPISTALPHLYHIEQVQHPPPPPPQLIQIVSSQVTSNLVCTLAPPSPVISIPVSSPVTMISSIRQVNKPLESSVSSTPSSPKTSVPLSQLVSTPAQPVDSSASTSVSTPTGPTTVTSADSVVTSVAPPSLVTPSSQSRESSPSQVAKNANVTKLWKGNLLIPVNTPQEQTNSKKPFVLAYTVAYHSADLPCVLRSSVPFVPPKIIWKSLFPQVSFTDFNKTLSACSILQRYMTVLEQAALQNNLTANGISSCKLVPLDELDNKFLEVEEKLRRDAEKNSDFTQS